MESCNDPSFARSVLLVDDDLQSLYLSRQILQKAEFETIFVLSDSREVSSFLESHNVSIILLDLVMPFLTGQELLVTLSKEYPETGVIVMSSADEIDTVIDCMKMGAIDYLLKPVSPHRLVASVRKGFELNALKDETCRLKKSLLDDTLEHEEAFADIISRNQKMRTIFRYIEAIGRSREPVLVTGETGAGKELIARAIHKVSGRKGRFVAVNAAGLDDMMFSDTLFGHSKGAFSSADSSRTGLVASAEGGTLFLDEIGDLQELSQVKLLRILQEKTYYPLGDDQLKKTNARIICATNRDLKKLIVEKRFRKDFYYRLLAHKIHLPPLKERKDDLPLLLDHFLTKAAREMGKKKPVLSQELYTLLASYHFPGNIRELRAMVYDAVSCHAKGKLSLQCFRKIIGEQQVVQDVFIASHESEGISLVSKDGHFPTLKECEQQLIVEALRLAESNQSIAASLLGISRQALNRRIRRQPSLLEQVTQINTGTATAPVYERGLIIKSGFRR
jgi:DNA-binding NtrC family response regulator